MHYLFRWKLSLSLLLFYHTLIIALWFNMGSQMSFILERLVNCGIHFIYDLRRDFHITPYRWRLGWLSVENRRMYFLGIMAYRVDHHLVPSYICDFLSSPAVDPRRSSRLPSAASVFHIPLHRTTVYCHSFCYLVAYFWKSLFFYITSAPSLAIFKIRLMLYMQNRELSVS